MRIVRIITLVLAAAGLAGCGGHGADDVGLPSTLWEGGGATLAIDVEVSHPGFLRASFRRGAGPVPKQSVEVLRPGRHRFEIEMPPTADVHTMLETTLTDPPAGAEIAWTVSVDGRTVWHEQDRLNERPPPGYGFFKTAEMGGTTTVVASAEP